MSKKASIIAVGDEVLCGDVVNTNASFLSKHLSEMGIEVVRHFVVSDQKKELSSVMLSALELSDIILLSGGLGPTKDDITKEVIADVLGLGLEYCHEIESNLLSLFQRLGFVMTENNKRQCYIPENSIVLPNSKGSAPGVYLSYQKKSIALMPGPPRELMPMFEDFVKPRLAEQIHKVFVEKYYMTSGIGESPLEHMVRERIQETGYYYYNTYLTQSGVMIKAIGRGTDEKVAQSQIDCYDREMKEVLGNYLYSETKQELWEFLAETMIERNLTLSAAESCTGGLFSSFMTQVPGISRIFRGGIIAYDNQIKRDFLGVRESTLADFGAVSEETAREMAQGISERFETDCSVAITGIAGPDGGSDEKPVGLVWICVFYKGLFHTKKNNFRGDRNMVQHRSALATIQLLKEVVQLD